MKTLLIIKAGSTFPSIRDVMGDFEDWVSSATGLTESAIKIINSEHGENFPEDEDILGVIVTGSHSMVTEQSDWIQALSRWLEQIINRNIPYLGICFGHQLLANVMGGQAGYHPQGQEVGTVAVTLTEEGICDRLLSFLPDTFFAHATHHQTVLKLPPNAIVLAGNTFEPHHAFRVGLQAWGVQFHPEFSADIMRHYISEQAATMAETANDLSSSISKVKETPEANALIKHFVHFALHSRKARQKLT